MLDHHFREFMEFFFPDIAAAINWSGKPVFLDKELPKLGPAHATGSRLADKLAQVWLKDGAELWVLLHNEIQGRAGDEFNRRMFIYNYRITDRYNREVVSLGVVTGSGGRTVLGRYETGRWNCRLVFEFPVVKMTDWRGREKELETGRNPFALVVLAQLEALKTQGKTDRKYAAKRELILRLLRAGYGKTRTRSLLRFIDWIIRLPEELEQQLTREIETSTGGKNMPYVTSWERIAQKHGEEIGERKIVLRLLKQKPGDLDAEVTARIEQLSTSRLEKLVDALPGFSHPADLERWLKRKA
jgi:hypothetical protein